MADERAVSEVLGYSLVFSLILISIAIVTVGGLDSLQSVRDAEQLDNAGRAFEVLADNTADIYERDAPSRATELSIGDAALFTGTKTTITIRDTDSSDNFEESFEVTPLVFRTKNDNKIVYEGGAIFRSRPDAGRVVRPPPHFWGSDRRILTIVATEVDGDQSVAGTDVLARMKAREKSVVHGSQDTNLTDSGSKPQIEITSERANLWQRYLEERPGIDGPCTEPAPDTVRCDIETDGKTLIILHRIELNLEL